MIKMAKNRKVKNEIITVDINNNYYYKNPLEDYMRPKNGKNFQGELYSDSETLKQLNLISFKEQVNSNKDKRLILSLSSNKNGNNEIEYFVKTGLYAGDIIFNGFRFKIRPKEELLFKRMLNFANDIFIDNTINSTDNNENTFDLIIYMFIMSLEKTAMLGLPQEYVKQKEQGVKFKGSVDVNNYIKKNIPFLGKISYCFREHRYVQDIVDVLFAALTIVKKRKSEILIGRLNDIYPALKENYSGKRINLETISKALNHKSLQNPVFMRFKQVLNYAKIIITQNDLESAVSEKDEISGYLVDVSELFEIYLEKLLRNSFTDWTIKTQEKLQIYNGTFFEKVIRPDIVMEKNGKVVVFDAKFKKMKFEKEDVDREDLFQIHTYMSYYDDNIVCGGLLYPVSKTNTNGVCSETLFGNGKNKTKFIIDGVCVASSMKDLIEQEKSFLKRIKGYIE